MTRQSNRWWVALLAGAVALFSGVPVLQAAEQGGKEHTASSAAKKKPAQKAKPKPKPRKAEPKKKGKKGGRTPPGPVS